MAQVQTEDYLFTEEQLNVELDEADPELTRFLRRASALVLQALQLNKKCNLSKFLSFPEYMPTVSLKSSVLTTDDDLPVVCMAWKPGSQLLAVCHGHPNHETWCSHRGQLHIWNVSGNDPSGTLVHAFDTSSCLCSVAFNAARPSLVAAGSVSGQLILWDLNRSLDSEFAIGGCDRGHQDAITALQWRYHEDNKQSFLLTVGADGQLIVWFNPQRESERPTLICCAIYKPEHRSAMSHSWLNFVRHEKLVKSKDAPISASNHLTCFTVLPDVKQGTTGSSNGIVECVIGTVCGRLLKCAVKLQACGQHCPEFGLQSALKTSSPVAMEYTWKMAPIRSIHADGRAPGYFFVFCTQQPIRLFDRCCEAVVCEFSMASASLLSVVQSSGRSVRFVAFHADRDELTVTELEVDENGRPSAIPSVPAPLHMPEESKGRLTQMVTCIECRPRNSNNELTLALGDHQGNCCTWTVNAFS